MYDQLTHIEIAEDGIPAKGVIYKFRPLCMCTRSALGGGG